MFSDFRKSVGFLTLLIIVAYVYRQFECQLYDLAMSICEWVICVVALLSNKSLFRFVREHLMLVVFIVGSVAFYLLILIRKHRAEINMWMEDASPLQVFMYFGISLTFSLSFYLSIKLDVSIVLLLVVWGLSWTLFSLAQAHNLYQTVLAGFKCGAGPVPPPVEPDPGQASPNEPEPKKEEPKKEEPKTEEPKDTTKQDEPKAHEAKKDDMNKVVEICIGVSVAGHPNVCHTPKKNEPAK
jgi:hypothetical protein